MVLVALVIPFMLGMAAIAVDVADLYAKKRGAQNAADAAALAVAAQIGAACFQAGDACANSAQTYSGYNGATNTLDVCDAADPTDTDCFAFPYVDKAGNTHTGQIEVRIKKTVAGFFTGAIGLGKTFSVKARAVGGLVHGDPPPYTFFAMNSSCQNHTLVIRLGGQLTVMNAVYVNSCSNNDGLDLFGTGGNITAPAITTIGGWETHDGNTVTVGTTVCPLSLLHDPKIAPPQTAPGCPITGPVGTPPLPDPYANKYPLPPQGSPACTSQVFGTAVSYTPTKPKLVGNINSSTTSITASGTAVQSGDYIQIENEKMQVTSATISGSNTNLVVVRARLGTTAANHNNGKEIKRIPVSLGGTAASPLPCKIPTGDVTLHPGTYYGGICIGGDTASNCIGDNCALTGAFTKDPYSPNQKLVANVDTSTTTITVTGGAAQPVENSDVIQVDDEMMLVTSVTNLGGAAQRERLTVVRAYLGTTAVSHVGTGAGAATVFQVNTTPSANVTLEEGVYVMAGGGFHVCGHSSVSAPNVMIYNTQNNGGPHGLNSNGAIDQIKINTTGTIDLGPQTFGIYSGLTIFQDPALEVDTGRYNATAQSCDTKSKSADTIPPNPGDIKNWDIALASMASTPNPGPQSSGALGSVRGTIYAAAQNAMFADSVSGTTNLAILTGCIFIEGATSTFYFDAKGLAGTAPALIE